MTGRVEALLGRWLQMRCSIAPRQSGAVNADNHPVVAYGTPVDNISCRVEDVDEMLVYGVPVAGSVTYDKRMLLPADVVVMPFDQVSNIQRPDPANPGQYISDDPSKYIVKQILRRADPSIRFRVALIERVGG